MSGENGDLGGDVRRSVTGEGTYVHGDSGEPLPTSVGQTGRSEVAGERPGRGGGGRRGERTMVPPEEPTTYYGRPIVKPPVWTWEIPFYFFFGGLAGASAAFAAAATFTGRRQLARRAWAGAFVGVTVSPALLVSDLGKPVRFLHMLRVVKVTSPMSLGAWLLLANGGATTLAAGLNVLKPGRRGGAPEVGAALLGAPLATYTAALITNTTIPAWSEARFEMPFVFAASASASAAGAALLTIPIDEAEPARALGIGAVIFEEVASQTMLKRLGPLASAYEEGAAGRFDKAARALSAAGAVGLAVGSRRIAGRTDLRCRMISAAGGALLLAGAVCKRWSVFKAGFASAEDPTQTVITQRDRIAAGAPGA